MTLQLFTAFHANLDFSSVPEVDLPRVLDRCYWPLLQIAEEVPSLFARHQEPDKETDQTRWAWGTHHGISSSRLSPSARRRRSASECWMVVSPEGVTR